MASDENPADTVTEQAAQVVFDYKPAAPMVIARALAAAGLLADPADRDELRKVADENERLLAANLALREKQFDPDGDFVSLAVEWQTKAEQLAKQRERAEADVAELEHRLACLLDELTGGRMSGTNYDVRTMVQEVEAYFERTVDDEVAELRATVERVRALADEWTAGRVRDEADRAIGPVLRAALDGAGEQP